MDYFKLVDGEYVPVSETQLLDEIFEAIKRVGSKVEGVEEKVNTLDTVFDQKSKAINSGLSGLQKNATDTATTINGVIAQIAERAQQATSAIDEMCKSMSSIESSISDVVTLADGMETDVKHLTAAEKSLETEVESLTSSLTSVSKRSEAMVSLHTQVSDKLTKLDSDVENTRKSALSVASYCSDISDSMRQSKDLAEAMVRAVNSQSTWQSGVTDLLTRVHEKINSSYEKWVDFALEATSKEAQASALVALVNQNTKKLSGIVDNLGEMTSLLAELKPAEETMVSLMTRFVSLVPTLNKFEEVLDQLVVNDKIVVATGVANAAANIANATKNVLTKEEKW